MKPTNRMWKETRYRISSNLIPFAIACAGIAVFLFLLPVMNGEYFWTGRSSNTGMEYELGYRNTSLGVSSAIGAAVCSLAFFFFAARRFTFGEQSALGATRVCARLSALFTVLFYAPMFTLASGAATLLGRMLLVNSGAYFMHEAYYYPGGYDLAMDLTVTFLSVLCGGGLAVFVANAKGRLAWLWIAAAFALPVAALLAFTIPLKEDFILSMKYPAMWLAVCVGIFAGLWIISVRRDAVR